MWKGRKHIYCSLYDQLQAPKALTIVDLVSRHSLDRGLLKAFSAACDSLKQVASGFCCQSESFACSSGPSSGPQIASCCSKFAAIWPF